MTRAAERGREIETKPIDAHDVDPVTQRVEHELRHARMDQTQRVAAAAAVLVAAAVVGHQSIPAWVVEAAKGNGRAVLVAFGSVVVDHIEHDLETGRLQRRHHRAEFVDDAADARIAVLRAGGVARIRAEETDGVVTPIIREAALVEIAFVQCGMHRQQRQRGRTQSL